LSVTDIGSKVNYHLPSIALEAYRTLARDRFERLDLGQVSAKTRMAAAPKSDMDEGTAGSHRT
jgi:hypothetical protein